MFMAKRTALLLLQLPRLPACVHCCAILLESPGKLYDHLSTLWGSWSLQKKTEKLELFESLEQTVKVHVMLNLLDHDVMRELDENVPWYLAGELMTHFLFTVGISKFLVCCVVAEIRTDRDSCTPGVSKLCITHIFFSALSIGDGKEVWSDPHQCTKSFQV